MKIKQFLILTMISGLVDMGASIGINSAYATAGSATQTPQVKVSGIFRESVTKDSYRGDKFSQDNWYFSGPTSNALYIDAFLNRSVMLGFTIAYDQYNKNVEPQFNVKPQIVNKLYLPEAYFLFIHQHFLAKIGQQYIDFGSRDHRSLSIPVTQSLSETNQLGFKFGLYSSKGVYTNITMYNSAARGQPGNIMESNTQEHNEYAADIGYIWQNSPNNSVNLSADYISNIADVEGINHKLKTLHKKVPGLALHSNFIIGPVQLLGDYVTALRNFDTRDLTNYDDAHSGGGSMPQAYSIEANYTLLLKHTLTLGFQGTEQAVGLYLPKTRWLAAYTYQLSRNISLAVEFNQSKYYTLVSSADKDNLIRAAVTVVF